MVLKQRHKTSGNGDKRHKDGLNNNREVAYSSKCERTVFEIQTMEIPTLPSPPPKRASLKKIRITGTEENIFDDKPSIMKDK